MQRLQDVTGLVTGEQGTYFIGRAGRAVYAFGHGPASEHSRPATEEECATFHRQHRAVWAMVVENLGLAYHMLKILHVPHHRWDELVYEEGVPTLMRCTQGFDGSTEFSTYACTALRNAYLRHLGQQTDEQALPETLGYIDQGASELEAAEEVQYVIDRLQDVDREILQMRYWQELTLDEIADNLGLSKGAVHARLSNALAHARTILERA